MADKQKEAIRATQIMNRLTKFTLGKKGENGETIDMSPAQVAAAKVVLAKLRPDLKSVENTGNPEKPMQFELTAKALQMMTKEQLEALLAGQSQNNG